MYVTGTFDAWGKTEKLEKKGDIHEKVVTFDTLPTEKILYKVSEHSSRRRIVHMAATSEQHVRLTCG